ncbi:unnamed protein product [Urochloa humidicola]
MEVSKNCASTSSVCLLLFLWFHGVIKAIAEPSLPQLDKDKAQDTIMRGISSLVSGNWNSSSNPCQWNGVNCSGSSIPAVVTQLSLSGFGLTDATILSSICHLDTLQSLDLSKNFFASLPGQHPPCPKKDGLQTLNFSNNRLSGQPGNFSGFPNLEVLDLSFNYLSGSISTQLTYLPKLRSLNLTSNYFESPVPATMVPSLEELALSGNRFSGHILMGLFGYADLALLDLSCNNLTGKILDEFLSFPRLSSLLLSSNNLSGAIPKSLLNLTVLCRFAANQNRFRGATPKGITKNIRMLDLSYNNLSGQIPSDLLSPDSLEAVDLTANRLQGLIPGSFS